MIKWVKGCKLGPAFKQIGVFFKMAFDAWTCFLPSLSIGPAQLRRRHDEHKNNKLLPFNVVFSEDAEARWAHKKKPGILGSYQWPYSALILNPRASLETTYCTLVLNAAMFWHWSNINTCANDESQLIHLKVLMSCVIHALCWDKIYYGSVPFSSKRTAFLATD